MKFLVVASLSLFFLAPSLGQAADQAKIKAMLDAYRNVRVAEKGSGGEAAADLILQERELDLLDEGMTEEEIVQLKSSVDKGMVQEKQDLSEAHQFDKLLIEASGLDSMDWGQMNEKIFPFALAYPDIAAKFKKMCNHLFKTDINSFLLNDSGKTNLLRMGMALLILNKANDLNVPEQDLKRLTEVVSSNLEEYLMQAADQPFAVRHPAIGLPETQTKFAFDIFKLSEISRGSPVFKLIFKNWEENKGRNWKEELRVRYQAYRAAVNGLSPQGRRAWNIVTGLWLLVFSAPIWHPMSWGQLEAWAGALIGASFFKLAQWLPPGGVYRFYNQQYDRLRPRQRLEKATASVLKYSAHENHRDDFCRIVLDLHR